MIQFDQVSFSYGDRPVLRSISFSIDQGEQVGLIGANGAGKSTLMKAALGLISCQGKITVDGKVLSKDTLGDIRKAIGYVLQDSDNQMFMPTVMEDMIFGPMNYGLSRREAEERAKKILAGFSMEHLLHRQNHRLSGGEKRMAAIATVLAMEPTVMLMDEPSTALDPKNRRRLIETLNALSMTKLIATHDLDLVLETCDRVILLGGGEIVADGPAREILRNKALLEENNLELPLCMSGIPTRK